LTEATISSVLSPVPTTSSIYGEIGVYSVEAVMPKPVPVGGAIVIEVPYDTLDANCTNDVIGGSELNDAGFRCYRDAVNLKKYIVTMDSCLPSDCSIAQGKKMRVNIRLQNPSSGSAGNFNIKVYYEDEPTYNMLIA